MMPNRRLILALALLALPGLAQAQDFIRYTPPQLISAGSGLFAVPGTAPSLQLYNVGSPGTTDYERGGVSWVANALVLGTAAGGTGTPRDLKLYPGSGLVWVYSFIPDASDLRSVGSGSNLFTTAYLSHGIQGSKSKSLTDAGAAVSFVRIAVPTNGYVGGQLIYTANSTDGTNRLTTTGAGYFACADTGGTVTAGAYQAIGTNATAYKRANTLVCTVSTAVSTTNCDLQVTCTDNLAGVQTMAFEWRVDMPSPATVTPQ